MAAVCLVLVAVLPFISGELVVPPPMNLTLHAVNTDYTLHWDWIERRTATFTVQWISKFKLKIHNRPKKWKMACEEISIMSCDLTPLDLHYLCIYTLRVRANMNGHYSEWVQKDFAPAKDAAVGPPSSVVVSPVDSVLEVSILEPQTSVNTSMKEHIQSLYFRFQYWERHTDPQGLRKSAMDSASTVVTLQDLKSWTWYCVSVQSRSLEPIRTSAFTAPVCKRTQGGLPWWQIFLYFLASLTACFLLVLVIPIGCFHCYKVFKNIFNPSVPWPIFLDQGVSPELLSPVCHSELLCDDLTVSPESDRLQIHESTSQEHAQGRQPEMSRRHSRQSSRGSRDSGVYSTSNSSNKPSSDQSSCLSSVLSSGPDVVRLKHICLAPENVQLIPDEGFGDMRA